MKKLITKTLFSFCLLSSTFLYAQPKGNRGIYLDGIDDYVKTTTLILSSDVTIEGWIKAYEQNGTQTIASNWPVDPMEKGFKVELNTSGQIIFTYGNDGESYTLTTDFVLEHKKWYHVACVRFGSAMKIYINGEIDVTSTSSIGTTYSNSTLNLGKGNTNLNFKGQLDEFRIYDSGIDDATVAEDKEYTGYNSAIAFWRFEEDYNDGNQLFDINVSTDEYNAELMNGALWSLRVTTSIDDQTSPINGSLRWAVNEANTDSDKDYIDFTIDNEDGTAQTLNFESVDIIANESIIIDGYSAFRSVENTANFLSPNNAILRIELTTTSSQSNGITLNGNNSVIKGLATTRQWYQLNGEFNTIEGCFVGLRVDGSIDYSATSLDGIILNGSGNHTVGWNSTENPAASNVIGNVYYYGIRSQSSNNKIKGNYIGVTPNGLDPVPVGANGIFLEYGSFGAVIKNIIANAGEINLRLDASYHTIQGNYINVKADLSGGFSSSPTGIGTVWYNGSNTIGGDNPGEENIIAYHATAAINLTGEKNIARKSSPNARTAKVTNSATGVAQSILNNKIYCNKSGILNAPLEVTPPVISGKITGGVSEITISNLTAEGYKKIYFYRNNSCNKNQGEEFVLSAETNNGDETYRYSGTDFKLGDHITVMYSSMYGSSEFSSILSLTLPKAKAATQITSTGFTANWEGKESATFDLEVATDSSFSQIISGYPVKGITDSTYQVTGLTPNTIYFYRVRLNGNTDNSNFKMTSTIKPAGSGNAISFNGLNQFIDIDTLEEKFNNGFTFSAWVYPEGPNNNEVVFDFGNGVNTNNIQLSRIEFENQLSLKVYESGAVLAQLNVPNCLEPFSWQHYTITINKSSGELILYKNGNLVGFTTIQAPNNQIRTLNFIGKGSGTNPNYFKGKIDEVTIWNTALNEDQIKGNICKKLIGDESNLVSYFRFDEKIGNITENRSALSKSDARLVNIPSWVFSGAPLGDNSIYLFGNSATSITLVDSELVVVDNFILNTQDKGIYVYAVNEKPSQATSPVGTNIKNTSHYYGVFPIGFTDYKVSLNYGSNSKINGKATESYTNILNRADNSVAQWNIVSNFSIDTINNIVASAAAPYPPITGRAEFITGSSFTNPLQMYSASNHTQSSFQLNWKNLGSTYELELATDNNFDNLLPGFPITNITDTFFLASQLQANTIYYARVKTNDDATYSNIKMASTIAYPGSGNAINLAGINDYINIGRIEQNFGKGFTFGAWINPSQMSTKGSVYEFAGDDTWNFIKLEINPATNGLSFSFRYVFFGSNIYEANVNINNAIKFDEWQYITTTYDFDSGIASIYNNGVLIGTGTKVYVSTGRQSAQPQTKLSAYKQNVIGKSSYSTSNYNGKIDEITIWEKALKENEIRTYMCKKLTGNENALIHYLRCNENIGTVIENKSVRGITDATLVNAPTWVTSGAAIGDESTFRYGANNDVEIKFESSDEIILSGFLLDNTNIGLQLYKVYDTPNNTKTGEGIDSIQQQLYYGIFQTGSFTYNVYYNYANNNKMNGVAHEKKGILASRKNNESMEWLTFDNQIIDTINNNISLNYSLTDSREIIPGFGFIVNHWIGTTDTDWSNIYNWSLGVLPEQTHHVIIDSTKNHPITLGNIDIYNLTVSKGAKLVISQGDTVKLATTLQNDGQICNAGTIIGTTTGNTILAAPIFKPITTSICDGTKTNIILSSEPTGATFHHTYITSDPFTSGALNGTKDTIADIISGNGFVKYIVTPTLGNCTGKKDTVTVYLNITERDTVLKTVCDNYNFNGKIISKSGLYMDTLSSKNGCDSIITLNLTVHNIDRDTITHTACDQYVFNSKTYTNSGYYSDTLKNVSGCDSIVTLNLTIKQSSLKLLSATACKSFVFNSKTLTSSGKYIDTLINAVGCDSVIVLELTINQPSSKIIDTTVCDQIVFNSKTITIGGQYIDTLTNIAGCDSIVTLNVSIKSSTTFNLKQTACNVYNFNGKNLFNSGIYKDTLTNAAGCDSIITLDLVIGKPSYKDTAISVCSTYVFNGKTLTTSSLYSEIFITEAGCDSIVNLTLTVGTAITNITQTACSSYNFGGKTLTTSGNYVDSLKALAGCDSIVNLQLTIVKPSTHSLILASCHEYDFNGKIITTSGIYTDTLMNAVGCDSVITLDFTLLKPSITNLTKKGCLVYDFNGVALVTSGIYRDTLSNIYGCDSIVILDLTIYNLPTVKATASINPVCIGSQTSLIGQGAATYNWSYNKIDNVPFTVTKDTLYTVTGTDSNGCTDTDTITIKATSCGITAKFESNKDTVFNNNTAVVYTSTSTGTIDSYYWDFGDGASPATITGEGPHTVTYSKSGKKVVTLTVKSGALTEVYSDTAVNFIDITTPLLSLNSTIINQVRDTLSAQISNPQSGAQFQWIATPNTGISFSNNSANPTITFADGVSGKINIQVIANIGSGKSDTSSVIVIRTGVLTGTMNKTNLFYKDSIPVDLNFAGTGPYQIKYNLGNTNTTIEGITSNTYTFYVKAAGSLDIMAFDKDSVQMEGISASFAITIDTARIIALNTQTPSCKGNKGKLMLHTSGGKQPLSLLIDNKTNFTLTGEDTILVNEGQHTAQLIDANGHSQPVDFIINTVAVPKIQITSSTGNQPYINVGGNFPILTASQAQGAQNYVWNYSQNGVRALNSIGQYAKEVVIDNFTGTLPFTVNAYNGTCIVASSDTFYLKVTPGLKQKEQKGNILYTNLFGSTPFRVIFSIGSRKIDTTITGYDLNIAITSYDLIKLDSIIDGKGISTAANIEYKPSTSLVIYDGISPNNDNINESFVIDNYFTQEGKMYIYDQRGFEVYKNEQYDNANAWNGENNPNGIYLYVFKFKGKTYSGSVEVRR